MNLKNNTTVKLDLAPIQATLYQILAEIMVMNDVQIKIYAHLKNQDEDVVAKAVHSTIDSRFESILKQINSHQDFYKDLDNLLSDL